MDQHKICQGARKDPSRIPIPMCDSAVKGITQTTKDLMKLKYVLTGNCLSEINMSFGHSKLSFLSWISDHYKCQTDKESAVSV